MKCVVILGVGMAGEPLEALGGRTPLEYANIPVMDDLASKGEMGTVGNVPAGIDTAGLDASGNFESGADAAVQALLENGRDYICIRVEFQMGDRDNVQHRIRELECLDSRLIGRIRDALDASGEDYRMLILSDHPASVRTHMSGPIPYVLYDSTRQLRRLARYSEAEAAEAGIYEPNGCRLMSRLTGR